MKGNAAKILKYAGIGIVAIPLSILTHELGHFLAYHFWGAANVQLHSVSVSADKEMLTGIQIASVSILGPIISYLTIGIALFATAKRYIPFWIILGCSAPIGRIVNFVYVYFRVLGSSPNPSFDEFNFSRSLNIEPLWLSIITIAIVFVTFFVFFRKAWKDGRYVEVLMVIFSLAAGLSIWSLIGGVILP